MLLVLEVIIRMSFKYRIVRPLSFERLMSYALYPVSQETTVQCKNDHNWWRRTSVNGPWKHLTFKSDFKNSTWVLFRHPKFSFRDLGNNYVRCLLSSIWNALQLKYNSWNTNTLKRLKSLFPLWYANMLTRVPMPQPQPAPTLTTELLKASTCHPLLLKK